MILAIEFINGNLWIVKEILDFHEVPFRLEPSFLFFKLKIQYILKNALKNCHFYVEYHLMS
jgi:hypothetical protein